MENHLFFGGGYIYKWAIFNSYVSLPEGNLPIAFTNHPFLFGIFLHKPSRNVGTTMAMETPMETVTSNGQLPQGRAAVSITVKGKAVVKRPEETLGQSATSGNDDDQWSLG